MDIILLVVHVGLGLGIIGLVLLQKGRGASEGASFGAGGSGTVFGASGSANFLSRTTAILATAFFVNSLVLAHLAANRDIQESVLDSIRAGDAAGSETSTEIPNEDIVPVPVESSEGEDVPLPAE